MQRKQKLSNLNKPKKRIKGSSKTHSPEHNLGSNDLDYPKQTFRGSLSIGSKHIASNNNFTEILKTALTGLVFENLTLGL